MKMKFGERLTFGSVVFLYLFCCFIIYYSFTLLHNELTNIQNIVNSIENRVAKLETRFIQQEIAQKNDFIQLITEQRLRPTREDLFNLNTQLLQQEEERIRTSCPTNDNNDNGDNAPAAKPFNLSEFEGKPIREIFAAYNAFHYGVISYSLLLIQSLLFFSGQLPPRFIYASNPGLGSGFGNRVQAVAWAFLFAMLSGRAFVMDFDIGYDVTCKYFDSPGFDWSYHKHPSPSHHRLFQAFINDNLPADNSIFGWDPRNTFEKEWGERPVIPWYMNHIGPAPIFENLHYSQIVGKVLGNWKMHIIQFLFSKPTRKLLEPVEKYKYLMKTSGFNSFISLQIRTNIASDTGIPVNNFFECAKHFEGSRRDVAFFLASDNSTVRTRAANVFGSQLFMLPVTVADPGTDSTFTESAGNGAIADWYMLGEGEMIISTAASSFGITAADRAGFAGYPKRFHVGGFTQCSLLQRKDLRESFGTLREEWQNDLGGNGSLIHAK